ncbi:MAG: thioredoxin domain-containing protein [Planctomycetes bacterium]|nr:thioredoxin domain-containing protein [Planctomycetota bacterium]
MKPTSPSKAHGPKGEPNLLAGETSPYLLQHAFNPVPWHPWSEAAIAEARQRDVPLLVSTGYSTCYWCHVMERECFEDEEIARLMGKHFVCVKVDREQRPDLDALWMTACQVFTSITEGHASGGWPLHVFLEPKSLRPFFAGTYFPPRPMHGRSSFPELLGKISGAWFSMRSDIEAQAAELSRLVESQLKLRAQRRPLDDALQASTAQALLSYHDSINGGFGGAPKFPQPSLSLFLQTVGGDRADAALARTLDGMALGGVRDQLDGGFHRYAVDATWTVPHFEKMLYDQGQLLQLYARQAGRSGDPFLAQVTRELAEFLIGVMQTKSGGFMAAIDAEVDGREGLNYIWSRQEIQRTLELAGLKSEVALAVDAFAMEGSPNFRDPHHPEDEPKFVLQLRARPEKLAKELKVDLDQWSSRFDTLRKALLAERSRRPSPRQDATLIASWNGLAIEGLAEAGRLMKEPRWVEAATRAADDVMKQLAPTDGLVHRSVKDGKLSGPGYLEDYACLAAGLLALSQATKNPRWLERASEIVDAAWTKFWNSELGWVEALADESGRIASISAIDDGATPSGAGVITQCLVALAKLTGNTKWAERAWTTLDRASGDIAEKPTSAVRSLIAAGELGAILPGRVPGGSAKSPVNISLVPLNHSFDQFALRLDIDRGHHVLSDFDISARDQGVNLECRYPTAIRCTDGSLGYEGQVEVAVVVTRPRPTPRPLRLSVRLQVCTDRECLASEERLVEG